jgi:hypothetical protein
VRQSTPIAHGLIGVYMGWSRLYYLDIASGTAGLRAHAASDLGCYGRLTSNLRHQLVYREYLRKHGTESCDGRILQLGLGSASVSGSRGGVADEQDSKITGICLAGGRVTTDIRCDARNDDRVNHTCAEDEFKVGAVERAEARLLDEEIAGIDHKPWVECSRDGPFIEEAVSDPWDHLTEHTHIRTVGAQYVAGMNYENASLTACCSQPVDATHDRESSWGNFDETILQIHVDKRGTLGNNRKVYHPSLLIR